MLLYFYYVPDFSSCSAIDIYLKKFKPSPWRSLFPESWFWPPDTTIDSALADDYILSYLIYLFSMNI